MQVTDTLIRRFLSGGDCTPEEADLVSQYLAAHPERMREFLEEDWESADNATDLPQGQTEGMLETISQRALGRRPGSGYVVRQALGWAAAAILILTGGFAWLHWSEKDIRAGVVAAAGDKKVAAPVVREVSWKSHENIASGKEKWQLEDGSVVTLYPGARIQYQEPLTGSGKREVLLEGQALFDVEKDAAHPFLVNAGGTVTTVLGTSFQVEQRAGDVTVRLFSGKVSVLATGKDYVLSPGEEMKFETASGQVKLNRFQEGTVQGKGKPDPGTLEFDNTPLPEVMSKLSRRYHVPIYYQASEIGRMFFTGSVLRTDSLPNLLRVIANMNGLTVHPAEKGYRLTVSPK